MSQQGAQIFLLDCIFDTSERAQPKDPPAGCNAPPDWGTGIQSIGHDWMVAHSDPSIASEYRYIEVLTIGRTGEVDPVGPWVAAGNPVTINFFDVNSATTVSHATVALQAFYKGPNGQEAAFVPFSRYAWNTWYWPVGGEPSNAQELVQTNPNEPLFIKQPLEGSDSVISMCSANGRVTRMDRTMSVGGLIVFLCKDPLDIPPGCTLKLKIGVFLTLTSPTNIGTTIQNYYDDPELDIDAGGPPTI